MARSRRRTYRPGDEGRGGDDQPDGEDPSGDDGEYVDCGTEAPVAPPTASTKR